MGETGKASNKKPSGNKPPAQKTAAKPKAFMLKMRLVAPDGTPFAGRQYRVRWGSKIVPASPKPPLTTGDRGDVKVLLDAPLSGAPQGVLLLLEQVGSTEVVVWSIPLQITQDSAPVGMPGISVAPAPPAPSHIRVDNWDERREYEENMRRYRETVVKTLRERMIEFWQAWDDIDTTVVSVLPLPPLQDASDDELWEAWQAFVAAYALVLNGYEAAWRLYNLGNLPIAREPTLPFLGSDFYALLRALTRFAYRTNLETPLPWPLDASSLKVYLEHIKVIHG